MSKSNNNNKNRKPRFFEYLAVLFDNNKFGDIILVFVGVILSIIGVYFEERANEKLFGGSFIAIIALGLVPLILRQLSSRFFKYLNNDSTEKKATKLSDILLRNEIADSQKNVENLITDALQKNPEVLNVEKAIYEKIGMNLENSLITKLEERFQTQTKYEFINNSLINELSPLTKNIERYIDRIQRNSIVNLFIGIIGTVTAIIILAFAILADKEFANLQEFFVHFLPRFTFVIFIQLFAFFFLRLYKSNLEDAKYFQNELTNLTAKSSSIKISYLIGNSEMTSSILNHLAMTERNFKLLKDETTIGIEKAKIESDFDKNIIDQFKEIISKFDAKR